MILTPEIPKIEIEERKKKRGRLDKCGNFEDTLARPILNTPHQRRSRGKVMDRGGGAWAGKIKYRFVCLYWSGELVGQGTGGTFSMTEG